MPSTTARPRSTEVTAGRTLAENLADAGGPDGDVVHPVASPIAREGGLAVLRGSLAPAGCQVKIPGNDNPTFRGVAPEAWDGGPIALVADGDPVALDVLTQDRGPHIVPAGILAETADLVETRYGVQVMDSLLGDLEAGVFTLDCGERDIGRIRGLANRYAGLPLGFADAAVVACAERNGGQVLTLDRRDLGVVAREGTITVLPG
jgi:uncharacterized protein